MSDRAKAPTWAEAEAMVDAKKGDKAFEAEVELVKLLSTAAVDWLGRYEPGLAITVAVDTLTTLMASAHPEDGSDGMERVMTALRFGYAKKLDLIERHRAKAAHRARTGRG